MKIKNIIGMLGVAALTLSSCKKEFLDTFSSTAVAAADAVSSTNNAFAALNGIHRLLYVQYDGQPQGGESAAMIIRDLMGEDIVLTRSNGRLDFVGHVRYIDHRNVNSSNTRFVFRLYYRVIANANVLINGIDAATGPQSEKDMIKGQALVYRAWAHFNLVRLWGERYKLGGDNSGLGVTLSTTADLMPKPRATVEEVYTQINADLDEAITLLSNYDRYEGDPATAKSQIDQNVAYGVKARVALTQQKWDVAANSAAEARKGFSLMDTTAYKAGFNDATNPEWIWASHQITDHNSYFYSYFASMGANFNGSNIRTQPKAINGALYNALPATDVRKSVFSRTGSDVPIPPGGVRVPYHAKKYLAASSSLSIGDVPMMRAAEMYLIEAEARARMGQFDQAQTILFQLISKRDRAYTKSTKTGDALIDEIMFHRRVELWGEGFRFTDLKRLDLPLNRTTVPNLNLAVSVVDIVPAGDKLWQWLIPQDEINTNPEVQQNPL